MRSMWSDEGAEAAIRAWAGGRACNEDIALRVYTTRLIGREPTLVLHGGGNTSVKTRLLDELGELVDVLCVKGSGWDMANIEPPGLPAVRLGALASLRRLAALDDAAMVNAARTRLLDASAPNPSVEVLLHAFLPHKFIDHSHADAILALVDQAEAESLAREVFGDSLAIVPYIMPGFALAQRAAEVYEAHPQCQGLLLLQHGLFTFGANARESYERHVDAVSRAEAYIASRRKPVGVTSRRNLDYAMLAPLLRGRLGNHRPVVLRYRQSPTIRRFVDHENLESSSGRGPATPDHVIRTKQRPLVLDLGEQPPESWAEVTRNALGAYRARYRSYVRQQIEQKGVARTELDPDPRIVLIPGVGLIAIGPDAAAADVAADIYEHTIEVILDAESVGAYRALGDGDIFDMEYWPLEQAKLGKQPPKPLQGRVVLVTGAASGIGSATARVFATAGAELVLLDRVETPLRELGAQLKAPWKVVDVRDRDAILASVQYAVETFGGLDGIVSNAGTAPQAPIHECPPDLFEESLAINLLAHQWLAAAASTVMRRQGTGGFLLFNASKAAFNPGKDFGPYAIAKAGLVALMKQYALEGGEAGIRSNAINADRVRTGLLPPEVVSARAGARGLDPDTYFRSNLLGREVTADDVARGFLHLALAPSTTGTVLTVDGGNIAASPR